VAGAPGSADCLAGVRGLELRNVGANYPFERSRRFLEIKPDSVLPLRRTRAEGALSKQVARKELKPMKRTVGALRQKALSLGLPLGHRR
jgi:hypothetical protein